jgi:hypothetical protein
MITKAIPITITTIPPATKLDIKFANEGVIYNISFFFLNNNEIKNSKINYIIYCSKFFKKIEKIFRNPINKLQNTII